MGSELAVAFARIGLFMLGVFLGIAGMGFRDFGYPRASKVSFALGLLFMLPGVLSLIVLAVFG